MADAVAGLAQGVGGRAAPTLDGLAVGARAVVHAPTALDPTVLRLLELGLTAGTEVELLRRAPWGDPLELVVRGTRLCLRREDAARFPVTVRGGR